jgi:NADPH-dependent 2,4-dienoyl-CoA reductase/sulfur reductase-like enzyme/nitrite reductase/ring-hydroxylating ferredoxin subunit
VAFTPPAHMTPGRNDGSQAIVETKEELMGAEQPELTGPDLAKGVALEILREGVPILGHALAEAVVVVRQGDRVFAVGATCTHYGGPLADGLVVGDEIRCPWHHACFSLRTGEATAAPALNPVTCWRTEERGGNVYVTGKVAPKAVLPRASGPRSIVIVGGGAAGLAAAEMLRRRGYDGGITMLTADASPPYDRPNLSKDYLAGEAPEEWIPLRPPEFFVDQRIDLRLAARVASLDLAGKKAVLERGDSVPFDALLLATGSDPVKLSLPGANLPHVLYLRTLADSRSIIARCKNAKRAVVLGASFIGLEVAAALRTRGVEVHVVAPDVRPLERVMGPDVGDFVRSLHEAHGVVFHLEQTAQAIDPATVTLEGGATLAADLVVAGIGVNPSVALAKGAGLAIDRGVVVDEYLETSEPGIFAAGDIVRWPDPYSGREIRVEHWVVAERQGQIAARNIMGDRVKYAFAPFFWSQHYDVSISYVGHAERWDGVDILGSLDKRDCTLAYRLGGDTLAVATIGRDQESLSAEAAFAALDRAKLAQLGK